MYCVNCGTKIEKDHKFCPACGQKIEYRNSDSGERTEQRENPVQMVEEEMVLNPQQMIDVGAEDYSKTNSVNLNNKKKRQGMGEGILILAIICLIGVLVAIAKHGNNKEESFESSYNEPMNEENDSWEEWEEENRDDFQFENEDVENDDVENDDDTNEDAENEWETTVEPEKEHEYKVVVADVTWTEAYQAAKDTENGYLVNIDSEEEFYALLDIINQEEYKNKIFWVGAARTEDSEDYYWIDAEGNYVQEFAQDNPYWFPGEPSFYDAENETVEEKYVELFYSKEKDGWRFNDVPDDLISAVSYYSGNVAYIVEIEKEENLDGQNTDTGNDVAETGEEKEPVIKTRRVYRGDEKPIWYEEYDEYGQTIYLKQSAYTDEDGIYHGEEITEYENIYNEEGKVVERREYEEGELSWVYEYEYDTNGNEIKQSRYYDGELLRVCESEYDEKGNVIRESWYEDGELTSEDEYEYDEKGNEIKESRYEDGELTSKFEYEYEYDEKGNEIKESWYHEGGLFRVYEYDEKGNEIKESWYFDGELYSVKELEYDEKGNEIKESWYEDGELTSEYEYEYEYDEKGNKIKESCYHEGELTDEYVYTYY